VLDQYALGCGSDVGEGPNYTAGIECCSRENRRANEPERAESGSLTCVEGLIHGLVEDETNGDENTTHKPEQMLLNGVFGRSVHDAHHRPNTTNKTDAKNKPFISHQHRIPRKVGRDGTHKDSQP
jgi:hypothetical protein